MSILISYKALIIALWFVAIFIGERWLGAAQYPAGFSAKALRSRLLSNISISAINFALSPLLILPLTLFFSDQFASWRPQWMQSPWMMIIDLIILDFFLYWWHRCNHMIPFLWRFHEVHHLDAFLDSTTALRFHFGEVFISAIARVIVITAFAIPIETVIIFEILLMVCTIFNHSNLSIPAVVDRYLRFVIVTPSLHWVHHHKQQRDTDSNYATILSLWDPLFNTRNPQLRWSTMVIGVEGRGELPLPTLLTRPFIKEP